MAAPDLDFEALRARMVDTQIAARGITDPRVLEAMRRVPRHLFVPPSLAASAYDDRPLPIGEGQTISQPYMVAAMTAALDPRPDGRVLEVGTGSGYQAAVLAQLAREVVSIERLPVLAERARRALEAAGITNVTVVVGDGSLGYPPAQPYDGILVAAAAPEVPAALIEQLAPGGRLVVPVGSPGFQVLTIVTRHRDGSTSTEVGEGCVFVPLVGRGGWTESAED
ncbi:MAG TPA: protein-L-isoaspartate(D-aspartate) O-methyltransferase [Vicinamibacterales bacterium]|nr:protein-L-isoaspartate(D-aspartate) O-methyltransferase [Vicinamibacterales bacterium]